MGGSEFEHAAKMSVSAITNGPQTLRNGSSDDNTADTEHELSYENVRWNRIKLASSQEA